MKKDTRQKILDAASTLFLKGGTHALSVRAIAEGAGMSTIGIYSHFKGKQGILDALYIEGFTLVDDMMKQSGGNTPSDRLLNACERVLQFSEAHAAHYNLIFGSNLKDYTPSEDAIAAGEKAFITLTKVVAAIIKKEIAVEERQDMAMQIWALCHGYISLNQHEIRNRINWVDWKARALNAIRLHVYALVATHNSHC
ncbi:TetR family transcriptional regulator [Alteromonas sp. CI.11.F.A3]|uniref:TetR/AcrR family transcriptional regulator n=1 Tax=Alteromonas sp. CI.11.F.A3 TaxID=3079555 RepID=UPI0029437061|nr:TetR family transcriptional regulator [Alteromonas sp. CI.11.F.A3]WOI37166.1 TetR family transcriptional regulator [Alteromonas sp. CI.11.F.A3]